MAFKYALFSTDPTESRKWAEGVTPDLTELVDPSAPLTDDQDKAWNTDDDGHIFHTNPPAGRVIGSHPKTPHPRPEPEL